MFYTKIPRNEAAIEETKNFLDKAFQGKIGLMINTLIQEEALTKEELASASLPLTAKVLVPDSAYTGMLPKLTSISQANMSCTTSWLQTT